jgi:hypothetical protein
MARAFVHGEADAGLGHAAPLLLDLLALVALQALQQVAEVCIGSAAGPAASGTARLARIIQPARSKAARSTSSTKSTCADDSPACCVKRSARDQAAVAPGLARPAAGCPAPA